MSSIHVTDTATNVVVAPCTCLAPWRSVVLIAVCQGCIQYKHTMMVIPYYDVRPTWPTSDRDEYARSGIHLGEDEEWWNWSFTFRAILSVVIEDLTRALETAETPQTSVVQNHLEEAREGMTAYNRQAYQQLAMTCRGTALGSVRPVDRNYGID